jgi:hypothetical protein
MKLFPSFPIASAPSRVTLAGIALVSLTSCQLLQRDQTVAEEEKADTLYPQPTGAELSPEAQELNDAARILAGLESFVGQDKHPLWRKEEFWKAHRTGSNAIWAEFANKRGTKVRSWAATEVADVNTVPVVFQPFGGPDFVFSHLLFPNAETYVLCGTAPCLDLPKIGEVSPATLADTVDEVRNAMVAALKVVPKDSKTEMKPRGTSLQGALPVLLALAARTGHIVESIEMMPLGDDAAVPSGPLALDPSMGGPDLTLTTRASNPNSACVITLRTGEGKTKRLFYFNQGLTDEALPESAALLSFLNKQPRVVAVLNETAHELHQTNTLRLQQYLAKHAVAIVQDPSGVPHRHFDQTAWNIQRYGSYTGAPSEFREFDQPDLITAYKDQTNRPLSLPFGKGLIGQDITGALMIARPLVQNVADLPLREALTPLSEDSPVVPAIAEGSAPAPEIGMPVIESEFLKTMPDSAPSIIVAQPTAVGPAAAISPAAPIVQLEANATAAAAPTTPAPVAK